jgi:N-acetyl-alpha-D-muramate 1-phosphate uridylyltransferase
MLPVVILSGGLATRLYPVTRKIPKSLIPIAGRPFIDHQLALLNEKGVTQVILCVGNLGEMIEAHVGDGSRYGLEVQYSYDGAVLLGTGGAIKKAAGILPDTFLILYGDSYLDIEFEPVVQQFIREKIPVLMTVYRNHNAHDISNILMKNGRVLKYNKKDRDPAMDYIDYGLIAIRKKVFDIYPADTPFDFSYVLSRLTDAGQVMGYEVTQRFYEIGTASGIKETEEFIMTRRPSLDKR